MKKISKQLLKSLNLDSLLDFVGKNERHEFGYVRKYL